MCVVVGNVNKTLAALGRAAGRNELAIALTEVPEGAVILAVQVQNGDSYSTFSEVPRPVQRVDPPILGDDRIGGVFEPPSLHSNDADG